MTEEPKTSREFEFHPLAELFPMLDKESRSFKGLVEDIKANRQYEPIWLLEGKILDGRNRYNACQHLGKEVVARDYVGNDPIGFVLSVNLHRRHLNTSQRAMVAAKLATFTHGGDRSKAPIGGLTDAEAAKLLNVGERSVERARQVLAKGDPSLIDAVEQGETSVTGCCRYRNKRRHSTGEEEAREECIRQVRRRREEANREAERPETHRS
jgi:ParB-like chromosome segregation protein Spo0J